VCSKGQQGVGRRPGLDVLVHQQRDGLGGVEDDLVDILHGRFDDMLGRRGLEQRPQAGRDGLPAVVAAHPKTMAWCRFKVCRRLKCTRLALIKISARGVDQNAYETALTRNRLAKTKCTG